MRHLRLVREWSLDLVARDTDINVSTVSRIERGLIDGTPDQRKRLATYFGKPAEELFAPVDGEAA